MKTLIHPTLAAALAAVLAHLSVVEAQPVARPSLPMNLFVQALVDGEAAMPLPDRPEFLNVRTQIQQLTGSTAPLELRAKRISRFKQQASCGRVAFGLWQPETRKVIATVGGQLNICEDGRPPLQECPGRTGALVPSGSVCAGSSGQQPAQDTAEVRDAIAAAIAQGGMSVEQIRATRRTGAEAQR